MKIEDEIIISKKEYEELKENELKLRALESAGVDNWDGYDYALDLFKEYKKNLIKKPA